jgi:hypothetical protein
MERRVFEQHSYHVAALRFLTHRPQPRTGLREYLGIKYAKLNAAVRINNRAQVGAALTHPSHDPYISA